MFRINFITLRFALAATYMCAALASPLFADGGSHSNEGQGGRDSVSTMFFGKESAGDDRDGGKYEDSKKRKFNEKGMVGKVADMMKFLEKNGITGTTNGVTKDLTNVKLHVKVITATDTAYDYTAFVWMCKKSTDCTVAANFKRVMSLTWKYKTDNSVNKGAVYVDPRALENEEGEGDNADASGEATPGAAGSSAVHMVYDIGDTTTTKVITAEVFFAFGNSGFKMAARGEKTGTGDDKVIKMGVVMNQGGSPMRYFGAEQRKEKSGAALSAYETSAASSCTNGLGPVSSTTAVPNGSNCVVCYSSIRAGKGKDRTFTSDPTACSGLTLMSAGPTYTATQVDTFTAATVLSDWNAMDANPVQSNL